MFGEIRWSEDDWFETREIGEDENKQYYTLEKRAVTNDLGKKVGSLFAVHDITEETRTLEMERYNATHDTLTDLYTKEYLYEVFAEMLEKNPDMDYYVIYANINDFKVVNDIFGNLFGDYVLKYIAGKIQNEMGEKAICGRFVGDNFGMCIPVDEFDEERIAKELTHFTVTDGEIEHFVLMHLGIFKVTDKTLDISYMFDRARIALSTVKEDYHTYIAYYDDKMRESVLWEQKIKEIKMVCEARGIQLP